MEILSTHMIHGFKTAFAAVLAYSITTLLKSEFGYWAVISTVIVMQVYVADSGEMCLYRFSGTLIGATAGVLVILIIPKTDVFIGMALFVTIGICSFLTRYKTRYRMAAITAVIVILTGSHSQDIFIFGIYRVFEICIGILCAFLVSVLIFPRKRVDVLKNKLKKQSEECAQACITLVNAFNAKQQNVTEDLVDALVGDVWENHALLHKINQHEALIYHKKFADEFHQKVGLMARSAEHLRNMVRTLNALEEDGFDIIMAQELTDLARESGNTLVSIMKNKPMHANNPLAEIIAALDSKLLTLRKEGLIRRFDSPRLIQVFSFYSSLLYFTEDILAETKKTTV